MNIQPEQQPEVEQLQAQVRELKEQLSEAKRIMLNLDSYYTSCQCADCSEITAFCNTLP